MKRDSLKTKWRWTASYSARTISEAVREICAHYFSTYPILILLGAWRRLRRRLASIWLPRSPGRPPVDELLVDLILEMKRENQGWGSQRISDELKLLGFSVSKKTVLRILRENGMLPPRKKFVPPSWHALIDSYRRVWGMDFSIVFDIKGRQLYIFNIIDWSTRKLIVSTPTYSPNSNWLAQQIRNSAIVTRDQIPTVMIRDNDAIYGRWLDPLLLEFGIKAIPITAGCPWLNGRTERLHKSEKDEALHRVPIVNVHHCAELAALYLNYYNLYRPHQALDGDTPSPDGLVRRPSKPQIRLAVRKKSAVNGLVTRFLLDAA